MRELAIDRAEVWVVGPDTERYAWALEMPVQFMSNTILKLTTAGGLEGLAKDLGFTLFNVKTTGRFLNSAKLEYIDSTPAKNRAGEVVGRVARPLSPAYQNSALAELQDLRNRYGSMDRYLDQAEIQCKVQAKIRSTSRRRNMCCPAAGSPGSCGTP